MEISTSLKLYVLFTYGNIFYCLNKKFLDNLIIILKLKEIQLQHIPKHLFKRLKFL